MIRGFSMTSMYGYQRRVTKWLHKCFDQRLDTARRERVFRFWEEAVELGQSLGMTAEDLQRVSDYVYSRPVGKPKQEVGGTMVTLTALCWSQDLQDAAFDELTRIERPEVMAKIRAKQESKSAVGMGGTLDGEWLDMPADTLAPIKCYAGRTIRLGDTMRHPDGSEGVVVYDSSVSNKWRVRYPDQPELTLSLGLQVGDKGQAERVEL